MPDPVPRQIAGEHFFVNNCFGSFYRGVLDWVAEDFYPRINYKVIGTYDKSVEFFNKKKELGHEVEMPLLPSVTLDPTYDFSPEERGGRFLWQTRYLAPGIGAKIFDSIDLREQDVIVTPIFSRYQGTFELIFWLESVYELLDFRTMLLQYTGGYNRWIRPKLFWSFIILPDEIKNFSDENGSKLDWGNTDATFIHIDNMNQTKFAHPVLLNPMFKLDSLNDNSTKYGGDQIAEYKLSATMTYEIELPTYMVLTNKIGVTVQMNFGLGSVHTNYGAYDPNDLLKSIGDVEPDYKNAINRLRDFRIVPEEKDNAAKLAELPTAIIYPSAEDIFNWNPIFSGKLVKATNDNYIDLEFEKGDILYCDSFNNNYISFFRNATGMICRSGGVESLGYKKAKALTKPIMTDIRNNFPDLDDYIGQDITVDVLNKEIYLASLPVEEIPRNDDQFGYHQLKHLKETKPVIVEKAKRKTPSKKFMPEYIGSATYDTNTKRVVIGRADGVETTFELPYKPDYPDRTRLYNDDDIQKPGLDYVIYTQTVVYATPPPVGTTVYAKDLAFIPEVLQLAAVYEFSNDDLENKSTEIIEIILPFPIVNKKDIILLSYPGLLDYEKDYELDIDSSLLTLKIKPRSSELVEIFLVQE